METTVEKALAELKATQEWKPIYFLTGDETYLIDVLCDYLENNIIDETFRDFDQKIVYGRDTTMADVISMAKQLPMLSPRRVVIVKEAQDLPSNDPQWVNAMKQNDMKGKKSDNGAAPDSKNAAWDRLAHYLAAPAPMATIVMCYRYKKLDKRTTAYKAIEKAGIIYEQKQLFDNQLVPWIATYVKGKGSSITEKSARLITETIGNDRSKLVHELDKVLIALPQGSVINDAAVEKYMGISKEYNVFELQNAIGRRDTVKCSRIINHISRNPKDMPIQMIIPVLYKYMLNVMMFIQDPSSAKSPYQAHAYEEVAQRYTLSKLALCIGYLHEADLLSKGVRNTGTITDGEILKELVFKITHT
ncbi:MAG: DNA polymerase III subunit delta [Bacteroidales bacterium]|nr:DNA polymerase III subunit delta [Bacteroidales bacterium]